MSALGSLADIPASNTDVRFAANPARRKWEGVTVPFVTCAAHIPRLRLPKGAPFLEAIRLLAPSRPTPPSRSSVHGACS
jgi:hypothetical protein